ncbi:hypothetical protein KIH39_20305 [Telmatocola sphagniphila]|uniref:PA14 domain-containing protein n=1 Tax=Telmatocola sphagniphila TaxID=1123043 RepID=A0A8E6B3C3_9BACT|nr:PA14 domain-containing protein [Telmatocola sphagniphila]QVL31168.1 hypothetical protein KIH39_20305 [Telmatocola sphagniphila]
MKRRSRPQLEMLEDRMVLSVGGGYTNAGLAGAYFATSTLPANNSSASFIRTDESVDLNYAAGQNVGGNPSDPAYGAVSANNYSVRWTGDLIPAFSQTYTFYLTANQGARLLIRPAGTSSFTTLLDQFSSSSPMNSSATFTMTAGQQYDIEVDYKSTGGASNIELDWSSASTPRELIQPVSNLGINVGTAWSFENSSRYFADAIKSARPYWVVVGTAAGNGDVLVSHNAQGWPTTDASLVVWEGSDNNNGTYTLSFKGQAKVTANFGTFYVNGTAYTNILPLGASGSYNAATDTTTAQFVIPSGPAASYNLILTFQNTVQQTSTGSTTGVSNVSLMRPEVVGGSTPYPLGTLFTTQYLQTLANYSTLRMMGASGTNGNPDVNWSDRTTPTSWFSQNYFANPGTSYQSQFNTNGVAWEYLVAMANETGKDLYINVPIGASNAYITNLANLILYGSDGTNPYTSPQANPVWAPLNANLHVYVEYSNEVWNTAPAFTQYTTNLNTAVSNVRAGTALGDILNYDAQPDNSTTNFTWAERLVAYQTVNISNIFRGVFGNSAMLTRVRPMLCWFNDNMESTARDMLSFIDNYFNNGTGFAFVSNPEPVSYYIWGAGGGGYYDALNNAGTQSTINFKNGGFENVSVGSAGILVNPTNTGWNFSGTQGGVVLGGLYGSPKAPQGLQEAYLYPSSSMSASVYISTPGVYGISFLATTGSQAANLSAEVDVSMNGQLFAQEYPAYYQFSTYATHYRSSTITGYVQITTAGTYTFSFSTPATNNATMYIDSVAVTSEAAIFSQQIPISLSDFASNYFPTQTPNSLQNYQRGLAMEVNWAKAYGLNAVTYESGFALGGGSNPTGIQYYANYLDTNPSNTVAAQVAATNLYTAAGGNLLFLGTFPQWQEPATSALNPLMMAVSVLNNTLPVTPTNGTSFTSGQTLTLTPANMTLQPNNFTIDNSNPGYSTNGNNALNAAGTNNWMSWNVVIPQSQSYQTYALATTISGPGTYQLWVDNQLVDTRTPGGTSGTPNTFSSTINLAPGQHIIRIKAILGPVRVNNVTLKQGGNPPAAPQSFVASSLSPTGTYLTITDSAGDETGFVVQRSLDQTNWSTIATLAAPGSSGIVNYSDLNLSPGTTYYYRVEATNSAGASSFVTSNTTTPFPTNTFFNENFGQLPVSGSVANPTGANWQFNNQSGIVANGGIAGLPNAYSGTQAAYIQGSAGTSNTPGSVSQVITITADDYQLAFYAAARLRNGTLDSLPIVIDLIAQSTNSLLRESTITPSSNTFAQYIVPFYTVPAGNYIVKFYTNSTTDNMVAIDSPNLIRTNINHLGVGNPNPTGDASYNGVTYTVSAGGAVGGTTDQFRYLRNTFTGNGTLEAKVTGFLNSSSLNPTAAAGVMFRSSDNANASFAYALVTPGSGVAFMWRPTNGGTAQLSSYINVSAPVYLELIRNGSTFTAAYSTDGINWKQIGSPQTISNFGSVADVGLAVTSNDSTNLATAYFTNFDVTPTFNTQDIGSPVTAGSTTYNGSTNRVTVSGSGTGINGTSDSLQLASQAASGNTQISAQITGLTGGANSLAGIIYRDSTAANAAYVALVVSTNGTIYLQSRTAAGVITTSNPIAQVPVDAGAPIWLSLVNKNGTVSAAYALSNAGPPASSDWITLPSTTITFSSNCVAGLFATNGDSTTSLTKAIFNGVSISGS